MSIEPRRAIFFAVALLAGLLAQFSVNVVGTLPLAEIVLLVFCGAVVVHTSVTRKLAAPFFREPLFLILVVAQTIAFGSYIVSDVCRGTSTNDMIRGWSRMIFLGMDIVAFAYLFRAHASCFIWSTVGLMLGGVLATAMGGAQYDAYWKFGFGGPATIATFLIIPFFGRAVGLALIAALSFLHLSLDYRSTGGVCLIAAMLLGVQMLPRQFRVLVLIPALVLGTALTFWMNDRQRFDDDARGSRSTVERTAMMEAASEAFFESPMIGQGSWFSNSPVMENFQLLRSMGARLAGVHGYAIETEETNIAIHSQLLVSIAEGGIFGGTFFIVFGALLAWALWYCTISRAPDSRTPIFVFTLLNAVWNLLFSPFSGAHRIGIALGCGLILLLWREAGSRATAEGEEPEFENEEPAELHEARFMTTSTHMKP
ncbi:MAG: hypothetical protein ABIP20_14745 [Chthoniobacteraceae bacterium]